jgi:hypothetical protein
MAEYADREHYIPLRKSDLTTLLCSDKHLSAAEREDFRQFCRLASAVFHFEYQHQLEELKDAYAPFDPDSETKALKPPTPDERQKALGDVFDRFVGLMERANFKHLTRQEIEAALEGKSDWGLDMDVDFGAFERLEMFVRRDTVVTRTRRSWRRLFRKEEVKSPAYSRLVLILKLRKHRRLDTEVDVNDVYLKVFKNIPKLDLEMLLPTARVRLSRVDRALIIYPLAAGVALMAYNIIHNILLEEPGKAATAAGLTALIGIVYAKLATWTLAGAFGGYGYKSYYGYQVKKQDYSLRLTRSLYYQSLDNNSGVLMRLLDEAEEQECRETYLAYFCLWKFAPPEGWTAPQLDDYVELYLEGNANLKVDFEIGDALDKLERLHIVTKSGDRYRAVPLAKALEMLDYKWDNYFKYNNPEYEAPPVV